MTDIELQFKDIQVRQATVDTLLQRGLITLKEGESFDRDKWNIEELYHGPECNIGVASSDDDGTKDFPFHCHVESVEYLVCVSGRVILSFRGAISRIVSMGECASIPAGIYHSTKPLEPNTKLAYICIPKDRAFPSNN